MDAFCREVEAALAGLCAPLRPLLRRVDDYLQRSDASPLGQTLVICSPMLFVFFLTLVSIDLR